MKSKVLKLGLMISLLSAGILHALVTIRLPYPKEMQDRLKQQYQEIIMRGSVNEKETITVRDSKTNKDIIISSTQDPITSDTFNELFDVYNTDTILVAGVITTFEAVTGEGDMAIVTDEWVVHYFDAIALFKYFLSLLPGAPSYLGVPQMNMITQAYKNPVNATDPQLYPREQIDLILQYAREQGLEVIDPYRPLFANPVNKQSIAAVFLFAIKRSQNESGAYYYHVQPSELFTQGKDFDSNLIRRLNNKIFEYLPLKDKLTFKFSELKDAHQMGESITEKYKEIRAFIQENKKVIDADKKLSEFVAQFLKKLDAYMTSVLVQEKQYAAALPYYEAIMGIDTVEDMENMINAAYIRLGYIQKAPLEEQLRGLVLFEKVLKAAYDKGVTKDIMRSIFTIANVLYYRAQTKEEMEKAISYIKNIADEDIQKMSGLDEQIWQMNILMGRMYLWINNYDAALFYFGRANEMLEKFKEQIGLDNAERGKEVMGYWLAATYLKKYGDLQQKEATLEALKNYVRIANAIIGSDTFILGLRAKVSFDLMRIFTSQQHNEQFRNEIRRVVSYAKKFNEEYLQSQEYINDYEKEEIQDRLKDIDTLLKKLELRRKPQKLEQIESSDISNTSPQPKEKETPTKREREASEDNEAKRKKKEK